MHLPKNPPRIFLTFLVTFAALIAAWSVVGGAYGGLFRAAAGVLAPPTGPWSVEYLRQLDENAPHDTQVRLRNRRDSLKRDVKISSKRMAYMPTAFLIALTLATPAPWVRKRIALLWGLIGVHIFVAAYLMLVPAIFIIERGQEEADTVLRQLEWVLSGSSAGWAIAPLVIWVIVTLKYSLAPTLQIRTNTPADNNPS